MKVIFAGTPLFAATILEKIVLSEFEIPLVLTQPDRLQGRGLKLSYSKVKESALKYHLDLLQPNRLKDKSLETTIKEYHPDVILVVAYGMILPKEILTLPKYGCINIHASLLPRWRGAAPIQRALEYGDKRTGITIIKMDEGLDTGDILAIKACEIEPEENFATLHDKLMALASQEIVAVLKNIKQINAVKQSTQGITYAHKITKSDARINWNQEALTIFNKIRAFNPVPGAWTLIEDKILKIGRVSITDFESKVKPGTVIIFKNSIRIASNSKDLEIHELQIAGSRKMDSKAFLQGNSILNGMVLGN